MYDSHSLHGQFSGSGCFFISFLKAYDFFAFLNSFGTIFQISGPRNEMLSVPQKNTFYIW